MTGREMTYPETGRRTGTRKIGGRNTGRQVAGSPATGGHFFFYLIYFKIRYLTALLLNMTRNYIRHN
jgi:hypothetical protein